MFVRVDTNCKLQIRKRGIKWSIIVIRETTKAGTDGNTSSRRRRRRFIETKRDVEFGGWARRGLKSALETARVVFARVYRLHPSAHNFAPIERERGQGSGCIPEGWTEMDEDAERSCEWMSERAKDNNKRDEQRWGERKRERFRGYARYPPIDAVREEYSIRCSNIGKR